MHDQPVGYQLRHREMGVFQGECLGMGFWHPMSDMPEQGYLEFRTYEQAAGYRAMLCSPGVMGTPMQMSDLTIEPFDFDESERLKASAESRT